MKDIVEKIMNDPRYQRNIEYGEPRSGHPEGKIRFHIAELEENLQELAAQGITKEEYWKLKFLIHVHDTFKAESVPDSPILSPDSHASLARKFASEFIDDDDLLNMLQLHDVNYALWKQFVTTGSYDLNSFQSLLNSVRDWNLFMMFLIIDGSTEGKERSKLIWFLREVQQHVELRVDESWIL